MRWIAAVKQHEITRANVCPNVCHCVAPQGHIELTEMPILEI